MAGFPSPRTCSRVSLRRVMRLPPSTSPASVVSCLAMYSKYTKRYDWLLVSSCPVSILLTLRGCRRPHGQTLLELEDPIPSLVLKVNGNVQATEKHNWLQRGATQSIFSFQDWMSDMQNAQSQVQRRAASLCTMYTSGAYLRLQSAPTLSQPHYPSRGTYARCVYAWLPRLGS